MSLSFSSVTVKPCSMSMSNKKACRSRRRFSVTRSEITVAPNPQHKRQLSKQGFPLTDLHVQEVVHRQTQIISPCSKPNVQFHSTFLNDAYEMCRNICAEYAKTFYLGILDSFLTCRLFQLACFLCDLPGLTLNRNLAYDGGKTESYMGNLW